MRFADVSAVVLTAALLAGCAAGPSKLGPVDGVARGGIPLPLEELPPQQLAKGQCALFLWSRGPTARRIVMALNAPALARIRVAGRTLDLARTDGSGQSAFGHFARQTFAAGGVTLTLDLDLGDQRGLPGGAVAPSGVLDYRDPAGWSIVLPVGGLLACQDGGAPTPSGP